MRRGGVVLIRVHPATSVNVEALVRVVLSRGNSLVGQAALITRLGIEILPAGQKE